jgi:hypothetical protein
LSDLLTLIRTRTEADFIVVDGSGWPLRVQCDYCQSQHNYRGGPRIATGVEGGLQTALPRSSPLGSPPRSHPQNASTLALVSDRERTAPPMSLDQSADLELLLRRIIREEAGVTPVTPAAKWRGGTMVLRWNKKTYSSVSAWSSATGQERVGGTLVGLSVNPGFSGSGGSAASFKLASTSSLINAGWDLLARFGLNTGGKDYFGDSTPYGSAYDIGADEWIG